MPKKAVHLAWAGASEEVAMTKLCLLQSSCQAVEDQQFSCLAVVVRPAAPLRAWLVHLEVGGWQAQFHRVSGARKTQMVVPCWVLRFPWGDPLHHQPHSTAKTDHGEVPWRTSTKRQGADVNLLPIEHATLHEASPALLPSLAIEIEAHAMPKLAPLHLCVVWV